MADLVDRWKNRIRRSRIARKAVYIARKIVLPGFGGLNLYQVLQFLMTGLQKGRITNRASAVSFRILLAFPPLLIVLLSLIPFVPIENFQENLFSYISRLMPLDAFYMVEQTLDDLIHQKKQTLISVSFLLTLVYATNAFMGLLEGFSHSYHLEHTHGFLIQYSRALGLMVVFSLAVIIGVALITFSGPVLRYLQDLDIIGGDVVVFALEVGKWIVVVFLFEVAVSLLYRAGLSGKWRAINPGASFATLGMIIVSLLFAWYVNNFGNYNKLYGSVGTLLVAMLWLYFNTIVLLIGFEINASISHAKDKGIEQIEPEEVMES